MPTHHQVMCQVLTALRGGHSGGSAAAPAALPAAADQSGGEANYALAARWQPSRLEKMIYSTTVVPHWIKGTQTFWYSWRSSSGTDYYLVDPSVGTKSPVFDNDALAAELTRVTRDPWDGQHLPIKEMRFIGEDTVYFQVESSQMELVPEEPDKEKQKKQQEENEDDEDDEDEPTRAKIHHFEFKVATQTLRELVDYEHPDRHPSWASVAPDGSWVVFARGFNLWAMSREEYSKILDARRGKKGKAAESAERKVKVKEVQLTTDGEKGYSWGMDPTGRDTTNMTVKKALKKRKSAGVSWAKDSKMFALVRQDARLVGELWVIHSVGKERPELETYKYEMPGEQHVNQSELVIFDVATRKSTVVCTAPEGEEPWKDQGLSVCTDQQFHYADDLEPKRALWLSDDSSEFFFTRISRGRQRVDTMVVETKPDAAPRVVVGDRSNTFVDRGYGSMFGMGGNYLLRLKKSGDLIWWSQDDGWGHLYLYSASGALKCRLTSGPWHVQGIEGANEAANCVIFTACGRELGEDPYYSHCYKVGLDGSGLCLLNPGDADHSVSLSEDCNYFVDNCSRVDEIPTVSLLGTRSDGPVQAPLLLEASDFSALSAAGFKFPEPFKAKSADGVTDIYGVIYRPYDFDPNKDYPIVAYVYPGPQTEATMKSFAASPNEQGLAQFGFIVVTLGNRGGHPQRSKWYHNYGYGNLRDYGLADKKAVIEQLADRHEHIDIDRVGIYGHSGGGFMSTAAMLVYPDFFKVAVSSSGNHENDVYNRSWSEWHDGVKEKLDADGKVTFEYDIDRNSSLASNLKGHLLLTTGDIDNNVHHAGTYRMAHALIKANKRFDMFEFPTQRHGYTDFPHYWFWKRSEYFVQHLIEDKRWSADIIELQRDIPRRSGARKTRKTKNLEGTRKTKDS